MEKILNILTKDIGWKMLSLLMAAALWFVGMNNHDPSILQDYDVKLTILNKDKITSNKFVLLNESSLEASTINITFRGRRSQIANLTKARNEIVAYIDLNPIDVSNYKDIGKPLSVTVKVKLPESLNASNYERVNIYPDTKEFTLDHLVSEYKEVEVVQIGKIAEGYIAMEPVVEPERILISAARSIIETVEAIRVEVDIKDITEDFTGTYETKVFNENGGEVLQLDKSVQEVQVTIPIKKSARIPILNPVIEGEAPEGYEFTDISLEPRYVEVIGTEEEIAKMSVLRLEPLIIKGINQKEVYDLRGGLMHTRLSIKPGTPQEVIVTVGMEKQEIRTYQIQNENVAILNTEEDIIMPSEVGITLRGLQARLDALNLENIQVSIDLENLVEAGEYEILADVIVPNGVFIETDVIIPIRIVGEEEVLSENDSLDDFSQEEESESESEESE